jgi:hypothetical protein
MNLRTRGFHVLTICVLVSVFAACAAPLVSTVPGQSLPNQRPFSKHVSPNISNEETIIVDNEWSASISRGSFTQQPVGEVPCPWELSILPPAGVSAESEGSAFDLNYRTDGCTPNESTTWSITYGTNLSNPAVYACTFAVTYSASGFSNIVSSNGSKTDCTVSYNSTNDDVYFNYNQTGSPQRHRGK